MEGEFEYDIFGTYGGGYESEGEGGEGGGEEGYASEGEGDRSEGETDYGYESERGEEQEYVPDPDFSGQDFKDTASRMTGQKEAREKIHRSPEEAAMAQIQGFLSESIPRGDDQKIISRIDKVKNIHLLNVPTLVLAGLWLVGGKPLNKNNFGLFLTKYGPPHNVGGPDLLRYIRLLTNAS